MDIRSILKKNEKLRWAGMSRGERLEFAIGLSELVHELKRGVEDSGKGVQGVRRGFKRGKAA